MLIKIEIKHNNFLSKLNVLKDVLTKVVKIFMIFEDPRNKLRFLFSGTLTPNTKMKF